MDTVVTRPAEPLNDVSLADKYTLESGRICLTGIQALVRLPMMQRRRDLAAGHNTAGYISGYRGSPLGAFDQQLQGARAYLDEHHVKFQAGVNEDLAATAAWGTQQASLSGESAYDGVFAMWYGKGPGVDRSGDAFRHGNLAGTAPLGGVLALLGDDHICESSTTAHQSEFAMVDAMIPVLNPAGVQEILDYGLYGIALSRFAGCWAALKCVHDTVESAATAMVGPERAAIVLPRDYALPPGGLSIRWPDTPLDQEARLHEHKLEAVRAFCRANRLDHAVFPSTGARVGVVTTGKSYLDVRQAFDDLGIDEVAAERLGVSLYKVAVSWPLEPEGVRRFCRGLDLVVVVEEKRALIETQLKELLYGVSAAPMVIGKCDEQGRVQFRAAGRLDTNRIAAVIGQRVLQRHADERLAARVDRLGELAEQSTGEPAAMERSPYFCAGCPHSSSTRVPEGSRALAGIGCHYMAQWMDRNTAGFTQMGAEGASWIGEAPFSKRGHVFQNVGDGTYYHSGILPIRAAVAAGVNITFKILYNDAVAMTGGQAMDGPLTVPMITRQVHAEGAKRVVVVTDEPDKYPRRAGFAPGAEVYHRDRLDAVQRELRAVEGTTVLVYDQTCAAEKRRRRKRGRFPDPPRRIFINEAVCEGCGDCGVQSNCVAVLPLETEFGRKRAIDQSACNKDYSCVKGFCPSFVTVHGGKPRKGRSLPVSAETGGAHALPEPGRPGLDRPYGIVITGVGGTGVVTIGALLVMAAHLEGKGCSALDMLGLAQKGGAVTSHLRLAPSAQDITATRVPGGGADLLLGCDLVVAAGAEALRTVARGRTHAVINSYEVMTGEFTRNADFSFPAAALQRSIELKAGAEHVEFLDATRLATSLLGDAIATNLFLLGYAYQQELIPVSAAAIERAVELNDVAVDMNKQAFRWGRRAAVDREEVTRLATPSSRRSSPAAQGDEPLEQIVGGRAAFLVEYQNEAYADRYRTLVERVRETEADRAKGLTGLADAVARYYFKLLAYKDEYEVARLYTDGEFRRRLEQQFEGEYWLELHLAPPLLAPRDPRTGERRKRRFGPWVFKVFGWLAKLRFVRGSAFDVFGYAEERRMERRLIQDYEDVVNQLLERLTPDNHALAIEIASVPEHVRGFGHVKQRQLEKAKTRERQLLDAFRDSKAPRVAA